MKPRWVGPLLPFAIACVPASEERAPSGAAGFETEPSEATRGEPFRTRDGWTVTVERLTLQMFVSAAPVERSAAYHDVYLFDAKKAALLYVPGVPVGAARVDFDLFARLPAPKGWEELGPEVIALDVDEETRRRFEPPPTEGETQRSGRNMLILARAERDGVVLRIDAAIYGVRASGSTRIYEGDEREVGIEVDVPLNGLTASPLRIRVEELFDELAPFVAADANGDGVIATDEIDAIHSRGYDGWSKRVDAMFGR